MRGSNQRTILILLLIILLNGLALAGERYWVYFKDKGANEHKTAVQKKQLVDSWLAPGARERRAIRGLAADPDKLLMADLPLESWYVETLKEMGFRVHIRSRWLNAVSGSAPAEVLQAIRALPFVDKVEPVRVWQYRAEPRSQSPPAGFSKPALDDSFIVDYGASAAQVQFHNIHQLHLKGLNGEGVVVAMFDTGFRLDHPALASLVPQIIAEYDFVQGDDITANQPGDAYNQDSHGTLTFSVLGGYVPGELVGPAFGASFLLAKTEKLDEEINQEEDNWWAAAEWAESRGADIVSSSLGYSTFDAGQNSYSYQDMDGQTTLVTRAANELARRGVLVINSAGNEGGTSWHYITAPADGAYVLSVGALNFNNQVTSFSSRGPTADGRIKPDVSAVGSGVRGAAASGGYTYASGTSLSCPLTAGIAALLLQAYPDLNLLQMLDILRKSGDSADNPNNDRGWGKVDALAAWSIAGNQNINRPTMFRALTPRPNPAKSTTRVIFFPVELKNASPISIDIFNILGRKVATLSFNGVSAQNLVPWNLKSANSSVLPSGMYLYRVRAAGQVGTGKFIILH